MKEYFVGRSDHSPDPGTPPASDTPAAHDQPSLGRRHFLSAGSALAAGALAAGTVGTLPGRAQAVADLAHAKAVGLSPAHWIGYPEGNPGTDAPPDTATSARNSTSPTAR
ncbi:hypothetical protein ACIPSA_24785 [Streptomyces sp. NPDC086549]|uniref:hypothetical protein n=1 Tax=Streptomyces sp. NPDC086549 TaxID=3365752 RepID=UPI003818F8C2